MTLVYQRPSITAIEVVGPVDTTATASGLVAPTALAPLTSGDTMVALHGANFGVASLSPLALGNVFCEGVVSAEHVNTARFTARACNITVDHSKMLCKMGAGVGAHLLWTVTIANQSSANPRTSYRAPVITDLAAFRLNSSTVTVGGSPADSSSQLETWRSVELAALQTAGGDLLVITGDYFGYSSPGLPVSASGRLVVPPAAFFKFEKSCSLSLSL